MTVSGNLAFQSGALYLVQVNPSSSTMANVTGTASLAGNVLAVFAPGSYVTKQYDILHSAGLDGTTFAQTLTCRRVYRQPELHADRRVLEPRPAHSARAAG